MHTLFYLTGAVALVSSALVITQRNAAHAVLYLVVTLLSLALIFFLLGAPFVGALEIIVYAGAIMVLFVFVIMMLNLGFRATRQERAWLRPRTWIGPAILALVLAAELGGLLLGLGGRGAGLGSGGSLSIAAAGGDVGPREVGRALFGPYMLAVELASFLLLAGLVGAYHLGFRSDREEGDCG